MAPGHVGAEHRLGRQVDGQLAQLAPGLARVGGRHALVELVLGEPARPCTPPAARPPRHPGQRPRREWGHRWPWADLPLGRQAFSMLQRRSCRSHPVLMPFKYDLPMPPPPVTGSHFIVCGDNPLAYRIARELTDRYGEYVVVCSPTSSGTTGRRSPRCPASPSASTPALTSEALATRASPRPGPWPWSAPMTSPTSTRRCAPRNSTPSCGWSSPPTTGGSAITSPGSSATARCCRAASSPRPALVAAALGEIAPSHVRLSGRPCTWPRREDAPAGQVLCGLAVPDDPGDTTQLIAPEDLDGHADLVLAVADGTPRDPLARQHHPAARRAPDGQAAAVEQVRRHLRGPARARAGRLHPARRRGPRPGRRALPGHHGHDRVGADQPADPARRRSPRCC